MGFGGRVPAIMETHIQECEVVNSDGVSPSNNALLASFGLGASLQVTL